MSPRFLTILTGHNLPKIQESREPEPSIINEKTIADFTPWWSNMHPTWSQQHADRAMLSALVRIAAHFL
jgi:hypothetical protein